MEGQSSMHGQNILPDVFAEEKGAQAMTRTDHYTQELIALRLRMARNITPAERVRVPEIKRTRNVVRQWWRTHTQRRRERVDTHAA